MDPVEEIIERFDFERVHAYMVLTSWTWAQLDNSKPRVPTVEELKAQARRLLGIVMGTATFAATGGFTAFRTDYGEVNLFFSVEHRSQSLPKERA